MNTPPQQKIFDASVVQDKGTPPRTDSPSGQPSDATPPAYRHQKPKHHGSQKRRLKEVSGCIPQETFAELERMRKQWAKQRGMKEKQLSRSEVVGRLIKRGVQGNIDMQYGSMLEPIMRKLIKEEIQSYSNRNASMAFKAYYSAEQDRILTIQLLRFVLVLMGDGLDELPLIIAESQKEALANMKHHVRGDAKEQ